MHKEACINETFKGINERSSLYKDRFYLCVSLGREKLVLKRVRSTILKNSQLYILVMVRSDEQYNLDVTLRSPESQAQITVLQLAFQNKIYSE